MSEAPRRIRLAAGAVVAASLLAAGPAAAQQIAGEYTVEVVGWTYHLDRDPDRRELGDETTLSVEQDGDRIVIDFGSFASAMSTTRFRGRVGHDRFVAVWSSGDGDARVLTGRVQNGTLRGELLYSRGGSDAAVPGWTSVRFRAVPASESSAKDSPAASMGRLRPPRVGNQAPPISPRARPGGAVLPGESGASDDSPEEAFAPTVLTHTDPEAPTSRDRVTLMARADAPPGERVERTEIWMNGMLQGSSDGSRVEATVGPFEPGRVDFDVVAVSGSGQRSEPHPSSVTVRPAGESVIRGRIRGHPELVTNVQLLNASQELVATRPVGRNGRFRFEGIARGRYYLFVNDGKREARISPGSTVQFTVDGRSTYRKDFTVE